ncbi:MAG: YqcC family protein, partial [Kofleriaceae bacterium]
MKAIDPAEMRARLDAVIAALKAAGAWEVERPSDEQLANAGPFGMHTLAFEQWLRLVFVPSVEALLAAGGPWPEHSMIAVHATREWDGHPNADGMLDALRAFDALFEPEEPAPPSPPSAAQAYDASHAAFGRGERDAGLASIRVAIAADPNYPNAHNYAGWILSRSPRSTADLDEAIAHFRAAMELAPDDYVPLVNLCDTLVAAGRDADAIAEAERATTGTCAAGAHNWLGCRFIGRPGENDRAIAHFREATKRRRWGLAYVNLGKALENADRHDEWYEAFITALQCDGDFDRAWCHERMAAYELRHGWLRNALDSLRAALREDDKGRGDRRALHVEGLVWVEQQLRAAGIEPVAAGREEAGAWKRASERELPPGFLAKNELGEPLADDVIEVERLVRAERWADVAAQLEKLRATDDNKLFDAVGYAEAGADHARAAGARTEALAMMELVVEAYRSYAAGATSGGEGMARMLDVNRVSAKLAAWTAATVA